MARAPRLKGPVPTPETAPTAASAQAAPAKEAEGSTSAAPATDQAPASTAEQVSVAVTAALAEGVVQYIGMDLSSGPDQTVAALTDTEGRVIPVSLTDASMAISATSNRAPYTRGGIHFASTRTAITLPETTTPDQTRRLVADTAITLSLVHVASGQAVVLPRDLFDTEGHPDFDRVSAITEDLLRQVVEGQA